MDFENHSAPRPLQLITFDKDPNAENKDRTKINIHHHNLQHVLQQAGSLLLSIFCICGPSRKGKSFILSQLLRCLEAAENGQDIEQCFRENHHKPLDQCFVFRNGSRPITEGIWIWSKPFILTRNGEKFALLVIDTQGTYDRFTTTRDMNAIVGLSLLMSSVMTFNCFTDIQEDILGSLATYVEYGKLAMENPDNNTGKPFQKLMFLVRDFNNPDEFGFGMEGGARYINYVLELEDGQPESSQTVRKTVNQTFDKIDCCLMPYIGGAAVSSSYDGNLAALEPKFLKIMIAFITDLITNGFLIKELHGNKMTANEVTDCMTAYVDAFNKEDTPTPLSIWEANTLVANNSSLRKAMKEFQTFYTNCRGDKAYLNPVFFDENIQKSISHAVSYLKSLKLFGDPAPLEEKLMADIEIQVSIEKAENESIRQDVLKVAEEAAMLTFKEGFDDKLGATEVEHYFMEPSAFVKLGQDAKSSAVDQYRGDLLLESEKDRLVKAMQMRERLDQVIFNEAAKNELGKKIAEDIFSKAVEKLSEEFRVSIDMYTKTSEDIGAISKETDSLKTKSLTEFDQQVYGMDKTLHAEFRTKLSKKVDAHSLQSIQNVNDRLESKRQLEMHKEHARQVQQQLQDRLNREKEYSIQQEARQRQQALDEKQALENQYNARMAQLQQQIQQVPVAQPERRRRRRRGWRLVGAVAASVLNHVAR